MIKNIKFLSLNFFVINSFLISLLIAEPIVVLEYSGSSNQQINTNLKGFNNEDYSTYYQIKKNDSLSNIINKFYNNYGLNLKVVQSAVIFKNKHAFVRNNANFMFANKKLYLPSIKEIKNLVYKNDNNKKKKENHGFQREKEIYFFGN